jgi:DNA-binding winged helix-turn-helix (wHTH) protein
MPTKDELDDGFTIGDCEILPNEGRVLRDGKEIRPEPQTLRVLLCLAERDGKLVSRDNLIDEVWGGRAISDDPINRAINQVRKCLGDSGKESGYVETLPKRGYRLLKPVQLHSPAPTPTPTPTPTPAAGQPSAATGQRRWKVISAVLAVGLFGFMYLLWSVRTDAPPPLPPAKSVGLRWSRPYTA